MPSSKDIEDYLASRDILKSNIHGFHQGSRELYRVVAGELRKLLCDGNNSLLPRVIPGLSLLPLLVCLDDFPTDGLVFLMPSVVSHNNATGPTVRSLFDFNEQYIPLKDWLEQVLFPPKITIRMLIRSVADKESAHADREYNETLKMTRSFFIFDEEVHKAHIVAIGEYILWVLESHIKRFPTDFRQK